MAKQDKPKPPVTIETVKEMPLKTIETVEIVPAQESAVAIPVDDSEDCYIINEDTGELKVTRVRAGYAPAPMPFGFRLARNEEVPGK